MTFFLPLASAPQQAERIRERIVTRLKTMEFYVTPDRVYRVSYRRQSNLMSDYVGQCAENGEIIIAIFKNDVGYFVCTYSRGAVGGEPIIIRYSMVESVEFFD